MSVVCPTGKVIIEEEMKEEMKEDVDPHNGADDGKSGARPAPTPRGPRDVAPRPLARPRRRAQPQVPAWISGPLQPEPLCLAQQLRSSFRLLGQEPRHVDVKRVAGAMNAPRWPRAPGPSRADPVCRAGPPPA